MQLTIEVPDDTICGLLCCAFEGGSNYWCRVDGYTLPPGTTLSDFKEGGSRQLPGGGYWHFYQLVPLTHGGSLTIRDGNDEYEHNGNKLWLLNREALLHGLEVMYAKYPKHFADAISGNEDADTGDVYLQCCLFGEVVFG